MQQLASSSKTGVWEPRDDQGQVNAERRVQSSASGTKRGQAGHLNRTQEARVTCRAGRPKANRNHEDKVQSRAKVKHELSGLVHGHQLDKDTH